MVINFFPKKSTLKFQSTTLIKTGLFTSISRMRILVLSFPVHQNISQFYALLPCGGQKIQGRSHSCRSGSSLARHGSGNFQPRGIRDLFSTFLHYHRCRIQCGNWKSIAVCRLTVLLYRAHLHVWVLPCQGLPPMSCHYLWKFFSYYQ